MRAAPIRAVVTDLDGTVVPGDGTVSAATVSAAVRLAAAGIPLIAATARTPAGIAALTPLVPHLSLAVGCGGALGWYPSSGELLWRETIAPATVRQLIEFVVADLPGAGVAGHDGQQWWVSAAYAARFGATRRGIVAIVPAADIGDRELCAMSVCHPDLSSSDLIRALSAAPLDPPPTVTYSTTNLVDIAPAGIDKASGVRRALAAIDIRPEDAVAFGDMPNDLPMFAVCGRSVAMGNAHPTVLDAATAVAACVHGDGFARTLADLGLVDVEWPLAAPGETVCACPAPDRS